MRRENCPEAVLVAAGAPRLLGHRARGPHGDRVASASFTAPSSCCSPTPRCCGPRRWPAWPPSTRPPGAAVTVLTAQAPDPKGYGRILRDADGKVSGIVEEADATDEQRAVTEMSSGMFAFDGDLLADAVKRVPAARATGEEYLTEVPAILRADGHMVGSAFCAGLRRDPGREQSGPAGQGPARAQRAAAGALDGRGRDDRGSGEHLDRRRRADRAGRAHLAGHAAGRPDRDRRRRLRRPWLPAP